MEKKISKTFLPLSKQGTIFDKFKYIKIQQKAMSEFPDKLSKFLPVTLFFCLFWQKSNFLNFPKCFFNKIDRKKFRKFLQSTSLKKIFWDFFGKFEKQIFFTYKSLKAKFCYRKFLQIIYVCFVLSCEFVIPLCGGLDGEFCVPSFSKFPHQASTSTE